MRCPACGRDTSAQLSRCTRCRAPLSAPPPAQPAGPGPEPTVDDLVEAERLPWPNPAFPPYGTQPQFQPPRRKRRHGGYLGWILTGALALAAAAATIVLWPGKEPARTPPAAQVTTQGTTQATTQAPPAAETLTKYWVDTFRATEGFREPSDAGAPAGRLNKGTHYVFCKRRGTRVGSGDKYNHWWLLTQLDEVYAGGGARAWVSAFVLTHWGNDEAKDNDGRAIPDCPG